MVFVSKFEKSDYMGVPACIVSEPWRAADRMYQEPLETACDSLRNFFFFFFFFDD